MDAGNYVDAAQKLEEIVDANDENAEAYFLLGVARFNLGEYELARSAFERALELDPERAASVHHNLGALAYQMQDFQTAETEFKAALETDPDDPDTHYQLGATYLVQALPANTMTPDAEMLTRAEEQFEKALDLAPGKGEALVGLGNVYLLDNRVEEAVEVLEQAVDGNPEMGEALFALGRAYTLAGETEEARATLQRFLEGNPPEVWAEQARQILAQLGE
jgi:Flp pilus assembly protein TadD